MENTIITANNTRITCVFYVLTTVILCLPYPVYLMLLLRMIKVVNFMFVTFFYHNLKKIM